MRKLALIFLAVLPLTVFAAAPDWLVDPGNHRWIVCGGATNGVTILDKTGEGDLKAVDGGWQSVLPNGQPGCFYIAAEPWEQFRVWLGASNDVVLTVRYFDGSPGTLVVRYDSTDQRFRLAPSYPSGAWRSPDAIPNGQPLTGDRQWKTVSMRLPFALFTKRLAGGDIRIESIKNFALAGVAITRIPKAPKAPIVMKQELRVAKTVGLESFAAGARFSGKFVQDGDSPIVLEAELADSISAQQGNGVIFEPEASGGGAIQFVAAATYKMTVTTPGRYVAWERSFFPWLGSWNHAEGLDDTQHYNIGDGMVGPDSGWKWIRAGVYDLTAGEHTFNLSYLGGAKLDLIVLTRDDAQPDLAKLRSSYQGVTSGEIWTVPVKPFDVARWGEVQFRLPETVAAKYEYSADGGQTWTAFSPQDDLAKLPVKGGGTDSLRFHIAARSRDGKTPFLFGGGTLTYQAGPHNSRFVENSRIKIEIDAYGIKSIFDKRAGLSVAQAAAMHDSLLSLTMKKPGNATPFTCDLYNATLEQCEVGGTSDTPVLTLVHRMDNGLQVTTTGKLLPNGQSEWQMAIENPTEFEVAEFRFPVLTGIALGGDPADDWLFVPKNWGQVLKNPGAESRVVTASESTAMRWAAMWDDKQGIYLGIEDPRFEDYWFLYGGDGSGAAVLAVRQRTLVKPRSQWKSGIFRLALTGSDWHEGADIYRAYVAQALKPNEVHPYIKWLVDSWCYEPHPAGIQGPLLGWDAVISDEAMLMAAWGQMLDAPDVTSQGAYPYPAPAWGSIREFSQKLAVRRALGGMYISYLDAHLWCAEYSYQPRIATFPKSRLPADLPKPGEDWYRKAATYSYDGNYAHCGADSILRPLDAAAYPMAMGSRAWRDWLFNWTLRDINFGTDGKYYDQFNMIYENGRRYPDFDTYGCWVPATLDFISKVRKAAREKTPYFTTAGEVCNDVYGQFLDLHLTSGTWNRLDFFLYCLPHQLTIDGNADGGLLSKEAGGFDRLRFIWQVGSRFDFWPYSPELAERFRQHFLPLRRAVKSLLYDATFRDTAGLTVRDAAGKVPPPEYIYAAVKWQNAPVAGLIGRWFLVGQDGQRGAIVNLINAPVQKGATCTISTKEFGPVSSAVAVTFEGTWQPVAGKQAGDRYTFLVPESECSSVILAGNLAPLVEWSIAPAAAPGVTRKLTLKLTNPNAAPMTGTARLRLPRGWRVPATVEFGPIPGGQAQTFAITLNVPGNARKGRTDIWCDIATPTGHFSAYSLLVVNDPVVADFRGNPGSYHVWLKNLTTEPLTGTLRVAGKDGLQVAAPAEFSLPPEAEVSVPIAVIGQDHLHEISELTATVKVGRHTIAVVRGVMPTVPNGDFEIDGAGDHKPDWWMCRKFGDGVAYERLHLAARAHGGKYCLQLDPPQKDEKFIRAYPVNGAFRPSARYRVSVWIKSDSATGVCANVAGYALGAGQTGPEWKQFTAEFVQGQGPSAYVGLRNESSAPAFFDDFKVEEINTP